MVQEMRVTGACPECGQLVMFAVQARFADPDHPCPGPAPGPAPAAPPPPAPRPALSAVPTDRPVPEDHAS